ncbi:MAG: hypothetical protein WAU68_04675, partial [Vitreimonas sp.]
MKHIWGFFSALMATVIGGLILLWLQGPFAQQLNADRPVIDVYSGAWSPLPPRRGELAAAWEAQGLLPYQVEQILTGDSMTMARITVRNRGARTAEGIRITT